MEPATHDDLRQLREDFKDHAENDRLHFEEINKTLLKISDKLDPVVDVYKAVLLSKSFLTGLASVVVAIGAIGAGVMWLLGQK